MNNQERIAIVTGGGRGIGRATAIALAKEGYQVVINYAGNQAAAEETKALCLAANPSATPLVIGADISTEEGATTLINQTMEAFGRIDILVNNAGITRDTLLLRMKAEDFDAVIGTNLRGAFLCTKAVTKPMMKQRFGRIINISSVVGVHGNAGQANYAASKAGLIGFTKSVAKELATRGITANAIAPGWIGTDMTQDLSDATKASIAAQIPMNRMGAPEDVANAVLFFAKEESAYVTGQVLLVDGGMGM
ncbi:MAG: 3-oxoacyl-[acyl-carrier-protein] reductase [Lachnospiraceae bacterium]|nr:3-oxoacyl-[acyl-carrier-protein] reductase [Lachnospiraceae bacterium]